MVLSKAMRPPDVDKIRSEKQRSLAEFLKLYNEALPSSFRKATKKLLEEYKTTHPEAFKAGDIWTLDVHRKKVMDWLSSRPA